MNGTYAHSQHQRATASPVLTSATVAQSTTAAAPAATGTFAALIQGVSTAAANICRPRREPGRRGGGQATEPRRLSRETRCGGGDGLVIGTCLGLEVMQTFDEVQ